MNKPRFFRIFFADNLTDVCLLWYNIRMKFQVILDILFELLSRRRVTANSLAEKHKLSPRTVYRYVEVLSTAVPIRIKRGRDGGICLPDSYKLPVNFLTEAELSANHWLAVLPVPLYICFALEHGFQRETDGTLLTLGLSMGDYAVLAGALAILMFVSVMQERGRKMREWLMTLSTPKRWILLYILLFYTMFFFVPNATTGFIYAVF